MAGSTSLKAYDAMGRVKYEVDALGFVTGYVRNAFGEATSVIRYASGYHAVERHAHRAQPSGANGGSG